MYNKYRWGNRLRSLKADGMPSYMIFVDTETTQETKDESTIYQDLRLGVAMYYRRRTDGNEDQVDIFRFNEQEVFWEYVISKMSKGRSLLLLAHNAVFDMTVLQHIKWLSIFGFSCEFIYDNQITFIAKWTREEQSITILNTANWFQGSVDRWGQELGLPKLMMPDVTASDDEWYLYCERDVEVILEITRWYIRFLEDNKLGQWRYTIASQAFTAFRHRFMVYPIDIPDDDVSRPLARQAYKGGRTEVFKVGEFNDGPYYKIDVNSMYPYVMSCNNYPTRLHGTGDELTVKQIEAIRGRYGLIAHCNVSPTVPLFAETSTGRNLYPIGTFDAYLTTNEFYRAYDNGWLNEVYSFAMYYMRPIFNEYIDFFYGLKVQFTTEGKRLQRAFTKLYLNSLYGKFGQKGYTDEVIGETEIPGLGTWYAIDATDGEKYMYRWVGHSLIRSRQEGEGRNSFCAVAAHVTANARLYLYDAVLRAGREHVYYSDTDSMILDAVGYGRMQDVLHPTNLGAWALEAESDTVVIRAPKHYRFDGKWTMKGVRRSAKLIGTDTYAQEQWPGMNTILKSGEERYFNTITQKTLSPVINTGRVLSNGDVIPFVMPLPEEDIARIKVGRYGSANRPIATKARTGVYIDA
jgi:hypothetical protein